jgi:hypothetical protein
MDVLSKSTRWAYLSFMLAKGFQAILKSGMGSPQFGRVST